VEDKNYQDKQKYEAGPDSDGTMHCIVCGAGSHRTDWIKKSQPQDKVQYVACDYHTDKEVNDAVKEQSAPPAQTTPLETKEGQKIVPPESKVDPTKGPGPANAQQASNKGAGTAQQVVATGQTQPPTMNQGKNNAPGK
jgi:hypothetical protein